MKKKLAVLLCFMLLLSLASAVLIKQFSNKSNSKEERERQINIVTTFYPVYMVGLNLLEQIDTVEVHSLTELQTGCLHDYILTTEDMRLISEADILVINGGGMESFLEDVKKNYPKLTIIDASEGIEMLANTENSADHDHTDHADIDHADTDHADAGHADAGHADADHDHADHADTDHADADHADTDHADTDHADADHVHADHADADHVHTDHVSDNFDGALLEDTDHDGEHGMDDHQESDHDGHVHDHGLYNAHVWLDPQLYIKQINNVREGLVDYISHIEESRLEESKENILTVLNNNADAYISQIMELDSEIEDYVAEVADTLDQTMNTKQAIVFHDSFAYLANRVGIKVAYTVPLDSDSSLSAGEIAKVIDIVNREQIKLLFTEEQYKDSIARQIENETEAKVQIIDTVVTGDGSKDSYLKAMRENLMVIQKAIQ